MSNSTSYANEPAETAHAGQGATQQFLSFTIGSEEYGVDIMLVREVKGWSETTRLPNSPDFMRGVLNLRGIIVPIFDLRARFTGNRTDATEKHVIIIVAVGERTAGILVDTVSDILTVAGGDIKPAPSGETAADERFVTGLIAIEGRMVVILEMEKLFESDMPDHATPTAPTQSSN